MNLIFGTYRLDDALLTTSPGNCKLAIWMCQTSHGRRANEEWCVGWNTKDVPLQRYLLDIA